MTSGKWVALTPNLQLLKSPPEMILSHLESDKWDPETVSRAGAYQTEVLFKWSEYHHRQFRRWMAKQHLGQYSLSVIGGHQLQAGSTAQEFRDFLKMLEVAGQGGRPSGLD